MVATARDRKTATSGVTGTRDVHQDGSPLAGRGALHLGVDNLAGIWAILTRPEFGTMIALHASRGFNIPCA